MRWGRRIQRCNTRLTNAQSKRINSYGWFVKFPPWMSAQIVALRTNYLCELQPTSKGYSKRAQGCSAYAFASCSTFIASPWQRELRSACTRDGNYTPSLLTLTGVDSGGFPFSVPSQIPSCQSRPSTFRLCLCPIVELPYTLLLITYQGIATAKFE